MIFAIIKFILNMVSYVSDWWYGRTDSTANKTEFNLEELAGGSDNVIVGLLKSIDMIHSTTLNHISQLKQFIDNAEECHVSGIKLSVNCLKHAESSLWHNRNLFFTSLESLKHNLQTTKSSICDKMSHTFDYIDNSYPDDNDTVDNDDTVDERMDTKSQEIKLLQKRVEKLEELIKGVVSPTINVQMYCPQESTVVTNAAEKLQKQLEKVDKMMQFASCLSPESAQPNVPLLILCMNSSRLGTDALGSIKGISDLKRTALVVVQYKELHALSSSTSKQILIEPEFKKLGGIFDIAYTKDQGLYDCELNTQAVTDIISFIKRL